MTTTTEVTDDRAVEFMHALAASDVDVRNISGNRSEFDGTIDVEASVPEDDDAHDAVATIANRHGFSYEGPVGGDMVGDEPYEVVAFFEY